MGLSTWPTIQNVNVWDHTVNHLPQPHHPKLSMGGNVLYLRDVQELNLSAAAYVNYMEYNFCMKVQLLEILNHPNSTSVNVMFNSPLFIKILRHLLMNSTLLFLYGNKAHHIIINHFIRGYKLSCWALTADTGKISLTPIVIFMAAENTPSHSNLQQMNLHSCTSKLAS